MSAFILTTPVALIVFNRPETTARIFAAVREARPNYLLIVADGPRTDRPDDAALCAEVRRIVEQIDWPCEVLKNYSDINLGCSVRPATGITWVFEQVNEAIILEDDCLPEPSFFRYCQELLEMYRHDERIAVIRGDNWPASVRGVEASYRFSHYPSTWGWASWHRVWKNYDINLSAWSGESQISWLKSILGTYVMAWYWQRIFDRTRRLTDRSWWDYQFVFSCWLQGQFSIVPTNNLVSNIGGGYSATHTTVKDDPRLDRQLTQMTFPLHHPGEVRRDLNDEITGDVTLARYEWWLRKTTARFMKRVMVDDYGKTI